MRAAVLGLAAWCAACAGIRIEAEGYTVRAPDGFDLRVYRAFETRGGAGRRWPASGVLAYVQGSEDRTVLDRLGDLAGAAAMGLDILMAERRGVGPDGTVDAALSRRFAAKEDRVRDHAAALSDYLASRHASGPVVLVGASEGGDVAAAIAARDRRVTHLVLLGCGGGWTQAQELRFLVERDPAAYGLGGPKELEAALSEIRASPGVDRTWLGHPYRRWASYAFRAPLEDLRLVDCPVLLVHGSADRSVPVESARAARDAFAAAGRTNLAYVELPDVDHRFVHVPTGRSARPLVEIEIVRWLAAHGACDAADADRYVARVGRSHPEWFGD